MCSSDINPPGRSATACPALFSFCVEGTRQDQRRCPYAQRHRCQPRHCRRRRCCSVVVACDVGVVVSAGVPTSSSGTRATSGPPPVEQDSVVSVFHSQAELTQMSLSILTLDWSKCRMNKVFVSILIILICVQLW